MTRVLLLFSLISIFAVPAAFSQDPQGGPEKRHDILSGGEKLEPPSRQEPPEAIIAFTRGESGAGSASDSPQCQSARSYAKNAALELESFSRRLMECAQSRDFSNDCGSEFTRVRSVYSNYKSAVSDVARYCR